MITSWPPLSAFGGASTILSGTTAERPANPALADQYNGQTLGIMIFCSSISPVVWSNFAGVQV